ncbi:TPA: hypothetical protein ACROWL_005151, partial [Escherichia coli]
LQSSSFSIGKYIPIFAFDFMSGNQIKHARNANEKLSGAFLWCWVCDWLTQYYKALYGLYFK